MRTETSRQTIAWFAKRAQEKTLQLAPPFQRKPVWLDREKAYLADTVLRGLPIPEIYIHVVTTVEGDTHYSVVDGQQRIRALLDFTANEFSLQAEFTPDFPDRTFAELSAELQQRFWAYSLVVRELHEASDADVRDLFERLNRYVFALNAQELRNARFKGEFIRTASELADDEFWATNRIVTPADIRRMLDVQFVSELLVGLIAGPQHKIENLDDYYEMFEGEFPERAEIVRAFAQTQAVLGELVPDLPRAHWRKKSSFYSLFLVLGELVRGRRIRVLDIGGSQAALQGFAELVERALSKEPPGDLPTAVKDYAVAVGRAASDRDRRIARQEILRNVLVVKK